MRWNDRLNACALLAAFAVSASPGKTPGAAAQASPPSPIYTPIEGGDRDPALPPYSMAIAQDRVSYDEVGYASWYGPERAGTALASGEVFDPAAVSAAHASLPVPSYAEVTDLRTGRTILVRINDNAPPPKGHLVALSLGAARQLGVETEGVFAARIRRTNPPDFERNALAAGRTATERLATPPALLNALRKRLGPAPVAAAVAVPAAAKIVPKLTSKSPMPPKPVVSPKPAMLPKVAEVQSRPEHPPASGDARFVEDNAQPHWNPALVNKSLEPAAPMTQRPAATAKAAAGGWYLQVAAFSTEARAAASAARVGGTVIRAGSIFRVRTGPYPSHGAARAAVGAMAAKGYPGARVTR